MPKIIARPAVGRIKPSNMRMVVVLPEPLGPRKPKTSPRITCKCRSLTATRLPKAFVSLLVLMMMKAFGNLVAVNDLHLQVMRGDVFGFLGPNGSGKTTTIRMLLGLIRPTAGRAVIFGMDNADQLPAILQRVGAIVETPVFYPYLSGEDNLRVITVASGM